jgi:hypothetical protein
MQDIIQEKLQEFLHEKNNKQKDSAFSVRSVLRKPSTKRVLGKSE